MTTEAYLWETYPRAISHTTIAEEVTRTHEAPSPMCAFSRQEQEVQHTLLRVL
jgi:hypothetical protein